MAHWSHSVPPSFKDTVDSLLQLCWRIQRSARFERSILHPSKLHCLSESYIRVIPEVLSLFQHLSALPSYSSSSPSPLLDKLSILFPVLLSTLEKGEQFLQDCTYDSVDKWWIPGSARKHRKQWLLNNALDVSLSTAIFDVHLHDFLWCISMWIWVLSDYDDGGLCGWILAKRVEILLRTIWASANEEDDVKRMQSLLLSIGDKGDEQICKLICGRLSASASQATTSLRPDTPVPEYMWMDSKGISTGQSITSNDYVVVFEAKLMGRKVVRKQFHRMEGLNLFQLEAAVHTQLCHANVTHLVGCTDDAANNKRKSLLMEVMDQDLRSLIAEQQAPFSLLVGLDLMLQVAKGMEYLHGLGVMHRDLKSPNILIRDERGHMIVKIADFGLSKFKQGSSLYTTMRTGTVIWMAPEVMDDEDGAKYTKKADVYSFAIVCAEILSGLPPKELLPCIKPEKELCKQLKEGKRPDLPSSCPLAISSYIEKCWRGDATERPEFTEICRALRFFKACVLLGETEMLASPLQDGMLDVGVLAMQRTPAQRRLGSALDQPVLDIPYEVRILHAIKEQNSLRRGEGDFLRMLQSRKLEACWPRKRIHDNGFKYDPGDGSVVFVRWEWRSKYFGEIIAKMLQRQIPDSPLEMIDQGSLGTAFKCDLQDGSSVAVRWIKNGTAERKHVEQQMAAIVSMDRSNAVPLVAYCSHGENEHVLVSEYIPNAISLFEVLHGDMLKTLQSKILASSTADLLGEGSLGSAFKCDPGDGFIIAVRWLENVIADREHVERQVAAMLELKHKNLVPLLAHYSNTENVHVLVLEHITNGISLSNLLQESCGGTDGNKTLSGETILMVAEDAASGIQHLHDHGFTHGHIKSSNILLINNYTRCVLSDYGIATLVRDTAGNVGYGAPELSMSKEADVYSYGMLLLELLTGLNPAIDKETLLWVNSQSQEEKMSILEQRSGIGRLKSSLLMDMLRIASDCLNRNASQRPFMKQVGAMVRDSRRRLFGHCIE